MRRAIYRHGELRLELLSLFAERPRHGYEIMQLLRAPHGERYAPSAGAIYPRIQKLESEGLIQEIQSGRRRIFAITQHGREQLASEGSSLQKQIAPPAAEEMLRELVTDTLDEIESIQLRVREITSLEHTAVRTNRSSLRRFNVGIEYATRSLREILSDTSVHLEEGAHRPAFETAVTAAQATNSVDENRWSK